MTNATRYLEAAKIEQLRNELTQEGYRVSLASEGSPFDLTAEKAGRRLAYEVKAQVSLRGAVEEIQKRRKLAREKGFDSFRLVVVNPPHATEAKVEGLEAALATYFMAKLPRDLNDFVERWRGDGVDRGLWVPRWHGEKPDVRYTRIDVRQLDLDRLIVAADEIRIAGDGLIAGTVEIRERIGQDSSENWIEYEIDTPFQFDLVLDRALRIIRENRVSVDTSSWDDEPVREPALNSA